LKLSKEYPRLVIAGVKGDSGKTIFSLGLLLALREKGYSPAAFKKGPDYIDSAWLGWAASDGIGRNLDTYMMSRDQVLSSFQRHANPGQINVIEGARGLHDGFDINGTHSTAELAKLLEAPTVLVLPITKMTRTAAAIVKGCADLDPDCRIAAVILNDCAGKRHIKVAKDAIEEITGIPVIGAIPKIDMDLIPNRHLGLTTVCEYEDIEKIAKELGEIISRNVDVEKLLEIAHRVKAPPFAENSVTVKAKRNGLKIGIIKDRAFSFYYQENIEGLIDAGCEVEFFSAFDSPRLPEELDALIIGGGFPEVHLEKLSKNSSLINDIKKAVEKGLPLYAECGGLMYLGRSVEYKGAIYPLCDVFPIALKVSLKPKGHGYCKVEVDRKNPFFKKGAILKGHEFHYSYVTSEKTNKTAFTIKRGKGVFNGRDGLIYKNVLASYLHLHAVGAPEIIQGIIKGAGEYKKIRFTNKEKASDFSKITVPCY